MNRPVPGQPVVGPPDQARAAAVPGRRRGRSACLALAAAWLLAVSGWTQVVVYDLAADWSNVANPNGPWQINKSPGQPFASAQADWWADNTGQVAWADQPFQQQAHVPVWMKVSDNQLAGFASVGTVVMHSAESARTGTEFSSVVWTSPGAGTAVVSGGAWMRKNFDRPQRWELRRNGTSLTLGDLTFADAFTEANPFSFANGSGGAGATVVALQAGDTIELLVYRVSNLTAGHMVGVELAIAFTPVPEPSTLALVLLGAGVATAASCRRPRSPRRPSPAETCPGTDSRR